MVPPIKKWNGYTLSFHCWIRLRHDYKYIDEKKRRQLYSFYSDSASHGFEAFFTPDLASLVVCICTKKEFVSVQVDDLDDLLPAFGNYSTMTTATTTTTTTSSTSTSSNTSSSNLNNSCFYNDVYLTKWISIGVVYVPAKNPFSYSQLCVYVNGKLKRECDVKLPSFNDPFTNIRICGACVNSQSSSSSSSSTATTSTVNANAAAAAVSTLTQLTQTSSQPMATTPTTNSTASNYMTRALSLPFTNLKSVFSISSYKSSKNNQTQSGSAVVAGGHQGSTNATINQNITDKSLYLTSIPSGTQDLAWDQSTCLYGQYEFMFCTE